MNFKTLIFILFLNSKRSIRNQMTWLKIYTLINNKLNLSCYCPSDYIVFMCVLILSLIHIRLFFVYFRHQLIINKTPRSIAFTINRCSQLKTDISITTPDLFTFLHPCRSLIRLFNWAEQYS
jgi:hypothetical protein